jgi:hypothetical protein
MIKLLIVLLVVPLFFGTVCHPVKSGKSNTDSVITLKYSGRLELIKLEGLEFYVMDDSTFLSFYKDRVVMKLTVYETEFKMRKTSDSSFELSNLGQPEYTRFQYVAFRRNDPMGDFYKYKNTGPPMKIKVDSIWKNRISYPSIILDKKADREVDVKESNGLRKEYYFTKSKPDPSYSDSTILSFSKDLNGIPFSFNEELDKSRGMKLYKIQYIYVPYFDSSLNANIPRREFKFEIGKAENDSFAIKLLKGQK